LRPPVQQQKQQKWVLSWSIKSHSTKEVGWVEKKKQAAAAQRDLEQLCQFQQRGATSGLSHKNLNPGFNAANRIPSQHWFGVLKVCLCLFFYIATSDDCTSAGWNICELLSWDVLVIIWSSKHKGGRWSSKAGMWVNSIRTKDKCTERERERASSADWFGGLDRFWSLSWFWETWQVLHSGEQYHGTTNLLL
jgi:hypothetical protein